MRLDHLLSKEHLQSPCLMYVSVEGLSGVKPVAQAIVLRRVLMGGISTDSGRRFFSLPSTVPLLRGAWNGGGGCVRFSVWHTVGS